MWRTLEGAVSSLEKTARQPSMSYYEVYQGREPSWTAYEISKHDSYDRPHHSARHEATSLVPVRVIERGHVDLDTALRKTKTATFWDRSDNCVNYVVYPGADDYQSPNSSSYDYYHYGRSATDDYDNYCTGSYDYHRDRRTSSFKDHNSYGRSAADDYGYSRSPEYSRHYDHSDNYPRPFEYYRHNDHHNYRSYDAYRYR